MTGSVEPDPDPVTGRHADGRPATDEPVVRLERWVGPWPDDDRDAAFKAEVAASMVLDPLATLRGLSEYSGIPVGALARFVLARYATTGSEGLLHLGSATVERMWARCEEAEAAGTDEARIEAYRTLAGMISWLRVPLQAPATGEAQDGEVTGGESEPPSTSSS
ncbi:MAG: DUF6027 family protein [Actinomycetota bacterium]|nr:DUF6027 family protein [Actinomycetota bacterium]